MSDELDVDYKQLVIKKDFSYDDILFGDVQYNLEHFRTDLYKLIEDHIKPQGGDYVMVNMIGETLLAIYVFSFGSSLDDALKILTDKRAWTRFLGKVELKKIYNETKSNIDFYDAILGFKWRTCKEMGMTEKQIDKALDSYINKEIWDKCLNKKQRKALAKAS